MTAISVVVATYNGVRFLAPQLQSILAQTVSPLELLIGDDCSTDGTVALAEKLLAGSGVRYDVTVNDRRLGVTRKFERLIARATGDVIVLCDQDDEWLPNRLEVIDRILGSRQDLYGLFSNADLIGPDSEPLPGSLWNAAGFNIRQRRRWESSPMEVLMRRNVVTGATLAFRSSIRGDVLPISPHGWHDFWISALVVSRGRLLALDDHLVRYRLHGANQAGMPPRGIARFRSPAIRQTAHLDQLTQLRDLVDRFGALGRPAPPLLAARIQHLQFRNSLPRRGSERLRAILRHGRVADYWRYSSGLLSLGLDLKEGGQRVDPGAEA
jgi:glycosyltransferase involved in cell wall biosynthesis